MDPYEGRLTRSMFKSETGLLAYAKHMLEYFERCVTPTEPHWDRGAAVTRRWIELLAAPGAVSQRDIDRLLADMRLDPDPGSNYRDLYRRVQDWAICLGLVAPPNYGIPPHWL